MHVASGSVSEESLGEGVIENNAVRCDHSVGRRPHEVIPPPLRHRPHCCYVANYWSAPEEFVLMLHKQFMLHNLFIHVIITAYLSDVFRKCSLWIILAGLSNCFLLTGLLKNIKHDGPRADAVCLRLWLPASFDPFVFLVYKIIFLWGRVYCF